MEQKSVLLVERNLLLNEVYREDLEEKGHKVIAVNDGVAAANHLGDSNKSRIGLIVIGSRNLVDKVEELERAISLLDGTAPAILVHSSDGFARGSYANSCIDGYIERDMVVQSSDSTEFLGRVKDLMYPQ